MYYWFQEEMLQPAQHKEVNHHISTLTKVHHLHLIGTQHWRISPGAADPDASERSEDDASGSLQ